MGTHSKTKRTRRTKAEMEALKQRAMDIWLANSQVSVVTMASHLGVAYASVQKWWYEFNGWDAE